MLPSDPAKYPQQYARDFLDARMTHPMTNVHLDSLLHDLGRALRLDPDWFIRKIANARLREIREEARNT